MPERVDADVCVVGAGYAGLTAAWRLHQAGRSIAVIEARDRVGGRIWTTTLEDGTAIDRGGAWLAPFHDAMLGLAEEFGVETFPPGVLTSHGHLLREPLRRIHWAGTETATVSYGAMDGAARSGQRAADEILAP